MNTAKLEHVLKMFLEKIYGPCKTEGISFIVCGSMSSYLQGCEIVPNDIDVLIESPRDVEFIADLLVEYEVEESPSNSIDDWLSSPKQRVFVDISESGTEQWYMGRWKIDGVKVEIAYIRSDESVVRSRRKSYIWENGPDMYPHAKKIDFMGHEIKVIPLEIQLSTNMFRKLDERVVESMRVLKETGVDLDLLKKALMQEQYEDIVCRLSELIG